jgi:hypothetical protein
MDSILESWSFGWEDMPLKFHGKRVKKHRKPKPREIVQLSLFK